jgi:microcompartment protein CcmK/EutM
MGQMASKAGMAVEEFSALSFAAGQAEVTSAQLAKATKFLSEDMVAQGRSTSSLREEMLLLADQFSAMDEGPEKIAIAVDRLGKAGQDMIPFLNQGRAAIEAQTETARRLGLVVGDDFAKNADSFNDKMGEMKGQIQGTFLQLADTILPSLNVALSNFLTLMRSNFIADGILAVGRAFNWVFDKVQMLANAWVALGNQMASPFNMDGVNQMLDVFEKLEEMRNSEGPQESLEIVRDVSGEGAWFDALAKKTDDYYKHIADLERQQATLEKRQRAERFAATKDMFSNIATALAASGKKGFEIAKAFRIAETLMNTYSAAMGAYNAMASIPYVGPALGIAAAAAATAAGLANVANIISQKPPAAHTGLDYVPREQTYLLSQGERVLQPQANRDLREFLEREGGTQATTINVHIDGNTILRFIADATRDGRLEVNARAVR